MLLESSATVPSNSSHNFRNRSAVASQDCAAAAGLGFSKQLCSSQRTSEDPNRPIRIIATQIRLSLFLQNPRLSVRPSLFLETESKLPGADQNYSEPIFLPAGPFAEKITRKMATSTTLSLSTGATLPHRRFANARK